MLTYIKKCQFYFALWLCCLFMVIVLPTSSQNTSNHFFDIPNSLNRELGEMDQDDEGFIWFITNQGLCRYDGNDVKLVDYKKLLLPINTPPNHLLCYNRFVICTQSTKVYILNKITEQCLVYELNSWVFKMYKNKKGEVVFVTYSGQIWIYSSKSGMQKGVDLSLIAGIKKPVELMHALVDENDNQFLFFTNNKFAKFDGDNLQWGSVPFFNNGYKFASERFIKMSAVTSRFAAILFDNGNVNIYDKKTLLLVDSVLNKSIAAVLTLNDELVIIPGEDLQKKSISLNGNFLLVEKLFKERARVSVTVLFQRNKNKVLLSTSNGLVEFSSLLNSKDYIFRQKKVVDFFKNKSIRCIYKVGDELLVGTYSGFYSCTSDTIKLLNKTFVYSLQAYDKDHLAAGLEGSSGLAKYHIATQKIIPMPNAQFKNSNFHVTAIYHTGTEWLCGSYNNIFTVFDSANTWGVKPKNITGVSLGTIRQISKIRGSVFVACQEGFFKIVDTGFQKIYPAQAAMRVTCMLEAPDGIWLGTYGDGIVKINDKGKYLEQFGFNEGLSNNFVYSMVQVGNSIVIGTGAGVSVLSTLGVPHFVQVKNEVELYGLTTQEFNHSAFFFDKSKQQVILGGVNGLSFIDVKNRKEDGEEKANKIQLSYVKTSAKNASYQLDLFATLKDSIQVYSVNSSIHLKFVCIDDPQQETALFRIKGLSDQWQSIKLKEEINIYSLPPGNYSIEVKLPFSANFNYFFSKKLIVLPVFYQTILFKGIIIVLCLIMVYSIWQYRLSKIKKEHKMRSLIASDLHDDIGSTLNSISVYSSIAENQLESNLPNTKILLNRMGNASREMVEKMSDIVWTIHPKNDEFEKVLDRIRFFAAELLSV